MPTAEESTKVEFDIGDHTEPLAIVGLACRFPQDATDSENLWELLLTERSAWSPWPEDRIRSSGHYHPDPDHGGTFAAKGGHFMSEDPSRFDSNFFKVTKSEVLALDPQQRLVLENAYLALENAGLRMEDVRSSNTSVFVSGFNHDHQAMMNADNEAALKYKVTGSTNSLISNRVSWFYDLKGPSITVDTACSSSMVGFHLCCQGLKEGEVDMAVVTGVTALYFPGDITAMGYTGFLSEDGRCFSFDHRANGYGRGEGVGTVIVKRLSDAIRDQNTIRAVVRGTGVNQDGNTPGITMPSSTAQEQLIRKVYAKAGLSLADTMMVEAHGTGTAAGDPAEAQAIARCFGTSARETPLFLGSIKSNIGHLEGAAGVAGIIKSVMILESGIIPPNFDFQQPNARIPMKKWNLQIPQRTTPWPSSRLRRISINSFGVGGTNAHTVLDDAFHYLKERNLEARHNTTPIVPTEAEVAKLVATLQKRFDNENEASSGESDAAESANGHHANGIMAPGMNRVGIQMNGISKNAANSTSEQNAEDLRERLNNVEGYKNGISSNATESASKHHVNGINKTISKLVMLSAFDEDGVARIARSQAKYLRSKTFYSKRDEEDFLSNYAHTLSGKRTTFPWRKAIVASDIAEMAEKLEGVTGTPVRAHTQTDLVWVFTGQGAQWPGMGKDLLVYPVFRRSLEAASEYLKSIGAGWSLLEKIMSDKANSEINGPELAQPACTALQVALVDLLFSWGVKPAQVLGHSSGEIAAAYCAGRLSREAAWKVSFFRGVVSGFQLRRKGAMLAVGTSKDEISPYLHLVNGQVDGEMVVACFNSPRNLTVSGDRDKIEALKVALDKDGIFSRLLKIQTAYHSAHMEEVATQYSELLGGLPDRSNCLASGIDMVSSVTGTYINDEPVEADYWVQNLIKPVQFSKAFTEMCLELSGKGQQTLRLDVHGKSKTRVIMEIGPHGALQTAIKENLANISESSSESRVLSLLNRTLPAASTVLEAVGLLACVGFPIVVDAVNQATNSASESASPKLLVDVPGYVFNHRDASIAESRLSKNYRLRKFPRHDLFGAPVADWNADTPRWRHIIRLSEQPWLRDHIVTGAYVYPGVGYLIAAIEASRQMLDPRHQVTAFRLRDVSLKRALVVPDTPNGVETCTAFTRLDESSLWTSSVWKKFTISSYNPVADDWIEHATGYIAVDYDTTPGPVDQGREAKARTQYWTEKLDAAMQRCRIPLNMESLYDNISNAGLTFGPLFRNLGDLRGTSDKSGHVFGTVTVPDVAAVMPKRFLHDHLIHPSTMDSMMHLFLSAVLDQKGQKTLKRPMVPVFIKDVWVSAATSNQHKHQFVGCGSTKHISYGKYEADISIWDEPSKEARVSMSGIRSAPLEAAENESVTTRKTCHEMSWTPYLELLTKEALFKAVALTNQADDIRDKLFWTNRFQLATVVMVTDALAELQSRPEVLQRCDGHLLKYYEWMQRLQQLIEDDKVSGVSRAEWEQCRQHNPNKNHSSSLKEELLRQVEDHNADGKLAVRMGTNIVNVLTGEVDPLELMFGQDDLLDHVYEELVGRGNIPAQQRKYFEIVRENYSDLKILEVGAGTGSSTAAVLDVLYPRPSSDGADPQSSVSCYTFTDISSAFFEKARDKFKYYDEVMEYKVLDAGQPAEPQGFAMNSYDFIVAGNIIHATPDLMQTLTNLRQLLKPGGKIVIHEGTRQDLFWSAIAFGQLKGWWLSTESIRKWSPLISPQQWAPILRDAGFSGVDLELREDEDERLNAQSLMIASAVGTGTAVTVATKHQPNWDKVVIVTTNTMAGAEEGPSLLVKAVKSQLENTLGVPSCQVVNFLGLASMDLQQTVCVSLIDLERAVLPDTTGPEFSNIQAMLCTCKGLLWVTPDMFAQPEFSMVVGLLRTVRWERDIDEANLVTLSLCGADYTDVKVVAGIISRLFQEQFDGSMREDQVNGEFIFKDNAFWTSRLVEAAGAHEALVSAFTQPKPTPQVWSEAKRPIKLATSAPGLLNKLEWVTDETYDQPLGEYELEIEVKAVGLNFRDLMIAMGEHMAFGMGSEGAGIVTRFGSRVTDFQKGDRVVHICGSEAMGCFHTFTRVDSRVVAKIPASLSFSTAASLSVVYGTAIYSLVDAGRLEAGEKVLIHAAAGGVGQACIQLAQNMGAEVFVTVSSAEKKELLMKEYQIPEDHIFSSRDLTFVKGILRMTKHKGVDVVVNSLSGEALRRSWDLIAPFGRFVEIGKRDSQASGRIEMTPFMRNVTMTSVEFPTMMKHRPQLIKRLTAESISMYLEGSVREVKPVTVMNYTQIEEGMRLLQSGKGMGKIVFVPNQDDMIPLVPPKLSPYTFRPEFSYVLAGGLGGLGRSIALWMAEKGARNLIFLSRSGKITPAVESMRTALAALECQVHIFTCDVGDRKRLREVIETCTDTMPPIKGVIQGAMTLQDSMFENMTHEAFRTAVKPKVQGSWNLHELLPKDMDFFVLESSGTGILGNRSQANYAAGNTYQDFLAHHRRTLGLPASSIDLTQVLSVGYVAEHRPQAVVAKSLGTTLEALREDEMHILLEYLMDTRTSRPGQLVTGLMDLGMYQSRGMPAPTYLSYPLFSNLRRVSNARQQDSDADSEQRVDSLLRAACSMEEASTIVISALRAKLASLLATPLDNIDPGKSVSSNGVDSLVAMELRTYLVKDLKADVPILDIMGTLSLADLCGKIAARSKLVEIAGHEKQVE